ncbi:hypothetical protein Tco_0839356 [Tanacetum coccineum]|uniref:Uncharacterized protein n=1 Tax=Tanacetum coccineum TaxID=301880 RepID=A0ABQ5AS94_9ASTR
MSHPADEFSQHLSDDDVSNHEDVSDNGDATNKPKQQLISSATTILNIKLPILKKEEYDIWAMEMEHYLEYIDNDVWKNHLTFAIPRNSLRRFSWNGDAKEIWEAIRTGLELRKGWKKGYDRFQQLLSQLEAHGAEGFWKQEIKGASKTFTRISNVAFVFKKKKSREQAPITRLSTGLTDLDLLHEDLEQIDDADIEEMAINWQIAMIAIRMKKFYKNTGWRVRIDGNKTVDFDKRA